MKTLFVSLVGFVSIWIAVTSCGPGGAAPTETCTGADCGQKNPCVDADKDGYTTCDGDCNDSKADIHPGAKDVCGTMVDANCNGKFEEGCWQFCDLTPDADAAKYGWTTGCCPIGDAKFTQGTATPKAGSLIKGVSGSIVYYYASNGHRYDFPLSMMFASWEWESSAHVTVEDAAVCGKVIEYADDVFSKFNLSGELLMKPGTFVIGRVGDPARYAVSRGKFLRKIADDKMGVAIFGDTYLDRVRLLPNDIVDEYHMGDPLTSDADYNLAAEFGTTPEQDLGLQ